MTDQLTMLQNLLFRFDCPLCKKESKSPIYSRGMTFGFQNIVVMCTKCLEEFDINGITLSLKPPRIEDYNVKVLDITGDLAK